MGRKFLFVPSLRRGNGTGHLRRCLGLMRDMRARAHASNEDDAGAEPGSSPELYLYMPEELRRDELLTMLEDYGIGSAQILNEEELFREASGETQLDEPLGDVPSDVAPSSPLADFVVVDRRATSEKEYEFFSRLGVPVGIDEGGRVRKRFPLLIDTFPLPREYGEANITDPALLDLPQQAKEHPVTFKRLLVSFGGEDPARLTESAIEALSSLAAESGGGAVRRRLWQRIGKRRCKQRWERITVVEGPLFDRSVFGPDKEESTEGLHLQVIRAPESLTPLYASHDLVLSTFGLTAYEAAAAGASVILFHPSDYHRRLARGAGFTAANRIGSVDAKELSRFLSDAERVAQRSAGAAPKERRSMAQLLLGLDSPVVRACPACGSTGEGAVLLREEMRSFFRCPGCGLIYQIDFSERGDRYGEEYFFEEYRAQYGRSYLEDAANIRGLSRPRLRNIDSLLSRRAGKGVRLLDVGCAYGPFLQEAALRGYRGVGMDVCASAVDYVREKVGLPAYRLDFSSDRLPDFSEISEKGEEEEGLFDVLSMWFVIEHFDQLDTVLRRVTYLLKPGGIFCFSTPNERGGSGRLSLRDFLRRSPKDHHTLWSPRSAAEILRRYGFRVEKTVSTGHHPERFPFVPEKGPIFHIVMGLSKMLHMGDSFEIYAKKVGGEI